MIQLFVFAYLASVITVTAVLVVALRNPIYSALSLLIMFFHMAGLYVTLEAEFLAAVQIVVYAGAILVLYLFVVMLLNVKREDQYHPQVVLGILSGLSMLIESLLLGYYKSMAPERAGPGGAERLTTAAGAVQPAGNTESIGEVLYVTYLFPFEIASLILLVAMIGAVILAKRGLFEQREA